MSRNLIFKTVNMVQNIIIALLIGALLILIQDRNHYKYWFNYYKKDAANERKQYLKLLKKFLQIK